MKVWKLLIVISMLCLAQSVSARDTIDGIRIWPAPENTRVVLDISATPDYSYFSLSSPQRLVIDLKNIKNAASLQNLAKKDKRIKRVRTSKPKNLKSVRLVFELEKEFNLNVFTLAPAGPYGHRLVVDLHDKETIIAKQKPKSKKRDIIIAVDAGHGGEDPGSIGFKGTYEKRVTLTIAKQLAAMINREKGMKAVMIRTGDYFVNLKKRTQIARQKEADFLVSIHADAYKTPQPSGGSVWVVSSGRAESELSKWLRNREKNSEMLGGGGALIKSTDDDDLATLFADLTKEKSLEISLKMANGVISEMKRVTKMHKKKPQHASLAVLKASDIPSILVETGFISNRKEEQNLINKNHQKKLASAIFNGIKSYYYRFPPDDSLIASMSLKRHTISRGESLSLVAQRYNVSVAALKSVNNLRSDVVRIGQEIKIPTSTN